MAELFSASYQGGIELFFPVLCSVLIVVLFIFSIFALVKYVKKDIDLQRKKKEKEIELLQAQIDAIKEGKSTK